MKQGNRLNLDTREWLLTNGLGSFACGTVCGAHTRTYHAWLMAAIAPPSDRTLLLSHMDERVTIDGTTYDLSTHFWQDGAIAPTGYQWLRSFSIDPVPTWVWGDGGWQLTRQLLMPYGLRDKQSIPQPIACESGGHGPLLLNQILVRYQWQGSGLMRLRLRPLVGDRNFHAQQSGKKGLHISQIIEPQRIILQSHQGDRAGVCWQLSWSRGAYEPTEEWYWDYCYPAETERGLNDREDLYNPGELTVLLAPEECCTLEASVRSPSPSARYALEIAPRHAFPSDPPHDDTFDNALAHEQHRLTHQIAQLPASLADAVPLFRAGEQFLAFRASIQGPTILAGYPWFSDWGRDTLIALPGLAIATGRLALARGVLQTFGQYCYQGLIPNTFPDSGDRPLYNTIDAPLWWIETLGLYLQASQDWDFLREQYAVVRQIYKAFTAGTVFNIRVDALDGLVTWDVPGYALTWMDAVVQGEPITPRQGKAIEVNALWYSALCWADEWAKQLQIGASDAESQSFDNQARHYAQQAALVKQSLQRFWNPTTQYFYDTIAPDDDRQAQIRPNAVLALSVAHGGFDETHARLALHTARDRLLTPYGLRSLDPSDPDYIGHYGGGVWERDHAYHQGTVWSWLIGPFIRAWKRWLPDEPLPWNPDALFVHFRDAACLGSISEIFDGDPPHTPRGAIAQAWSVAELLRHWPDLNHPPEIIRSEEENW